MQFRFIGIDTEISDIAPLTRFGQKVEMDEARGLAEILGGAPLLPERDWHFTAEEEAAYADSGSHADGLRWDREASRSAPFSQPELDAQKEFLSKKRAAFTRLHEIRETGSLSKANAAVVEQPEEAR